ncbi:MAG: putative toxin-antitoxin system toxin component, PIN family [Verrucomicrobia subdivision 3 bacterium]|nr:putative toxin-antitoxin system toxin component, PIN family [Limisphaerales bacterium]
MILVVFDTSVLISAIGWRGPAHQCLALVARRQCRLVVSEEIAAEYESRVPEVLAQEAPLANAFGALAWVRAKALWAEPSPLGQQRSRDLKDERFIAAALAVGAHAIVSYDRDLLALEKPFGIPIMRPGAFLLWMEGRR